MHTTEATKDKAGKSRTFGWGVGIALLVAAVGAVVYQARDLVPQRQAGPQAYYTTDDGKTLFGHDPSALAPFDHGGKPAVLAHVYRCDGQQFVAYLERYTPEAIKAAGQLKAASNVEPGPNAPRVDPRAIQLATTPAGREVKRPGDPAWVPVLGGAGARITTVKCPHGKGSTPEPVTP